MIRSGLDVFLDSSPITEPLGVLTNAASLTRDGRTILRALRDAGFNVAAIFSPEHGYYGTGAEGENIADERMGDMPVYSLYGDHYAPRSSVLQQLGGLLIDLQDVGLRWYTYAATLQTMLLSCAAEELRVVVLDRPNPLGGLIVEGIIAEDLSFVAPAKIPVRYGLTFGELAQLLNAEIGANLHIIPMEGWRREMLYAETGLYWAAPSPGIPLPVTPLVYSGTCLLEGLNISEGRGTSLPFMQIGAPFIDSNALADAMNALKLSGFVFTPTYFRPLTGKYANERCNGVRIHVTNARQGANGHSMGLHLVSTLRTLYPEQVQWVHNAVTGYWFDRLLGTPRIREALERGVPVAEVIASYERSTWAFSERSREYWLYE
jgi:uncharacterized protein YbbC (DUF1343 family)